MLHLPDSVKTYLQGYTSTEDNLRTSSKANVYFFRHSYQPGRFLKIRSIADRRPDEADLKSEKVAIQWLQDKIWVPDLIYFCCEEDTEYLITGEISGCSSESDLFKTDVPGLLRLVAHGLKRIHNLAIDDCPFNWNVDSLLVKLEHLINLGMLKPEDLKRAGWHHTPQELLDVMYEMRPKSEEVVFTHGDYCLPNILVQDGRVTGVIDWGYSGLGDRYRDFAAITKSICRNLGDEWVGVFFKEYGISELDSEKMAFHRLLYDLT